MRHLRFLTKTPDVYFVGDRCDKNGNDRELYELITNTQQNDRSFITSGPKETIEIIKKILDKK